MLGNYVSFFKELNEINLRKTDIKVFRIFRVNFEYLECIMQNLKVSVMP